MGGLRGEETGKLPDSTCLGGKGGPHWRLRKAALLLLKHGDPRQQQGMTNPRGKEGPRHNIQIAHRTNGSVGYWEGNREKTGNKGENSGGTH